MLYSSYSVLGDWLRWAVALMLVGMVACGALWCGVYGLQHAASSTARERLARCRRERAIQREARRGIAELEVYLMASGHTQST